MLTLRCMHLFRLLTLVGHLKLSDTIWGLVWQHERMPKRCMLKRNWIACSKHDNQSRLISWEDLHESQFNEHENLHFFYFIFLKFFFETEGRHASTKTQEAVDHLASFLSSREEISQPGIKKKIFTLIMNKIFIRALKIMTKMATTSTWIC